MGSKAETKKEINPSNNEGKKNNNSFTLLKNQYNNKKETISIKHKTKQLVIHNQTLLL